ncbi:MEPF1 like [Actinidia chinensis var. chinensis]|uniref:Epidermal patterning factor-like protein n=1 Tax=Actinidia chinensis var. chinensis TaxID=1590841 RepID=A0A2R6PTM2_ACTCC|nr:MEPF1 like [Actinidia chinensis var. chinensis]
MKFSLFIMVVLLLVPAVVHSRIIAQSHPMKLKRARDTLQFRTAGSRLPECSHACGSCSPCRLAMVSFRCAFIAEAETCPMAYKCICNSKSFPVP